ncbi:MAG: tryptophan synthase beta chain [Tenuifilum sp.]|jgi:tryptophan synthase beta chain|uniref:tryptophan synthase subunit beta n=1 Tax=Tenuifilum sp. TaxID=2760880 RepID=UPI0024AB18A4|nr:tryptophan synthase subunit beta [Tenuifilum sp.]MDI3526486.1 tryptophan synthase beta chain [Tenuifilum sp.]
MTKFPDANGFYGEFGGAFIPELLWANVAELTNNYEAILNSDSFKNEFNELLTNYVGRPTPLYFAQNLSKRYGAKIYLKREDLCHTGAHKLNNVLGQILLAKRLGKKRIIAETGAGQHGVATATACALMGLKCTVFMGAKDAIRQKPNILRMRMLGAEIIEVRSGSQTLKDATNDAIRYWINNPAETHYLIGSTIGPHPYPDIVARLQSVISEEIRNQLYQKEKTMFPNYVIACVGGGSNAAGAFFHFIDNPSVNLIGVEAGGTLDDASKTAASILKGEVGIIHGCKTYLLQNDDGQIIEAHSVSAGLDYPGIGPLHAYLNKSQLAKYVSVYDEEAIQAALLLTRLEGIIPALESAHAIAALDKLKFKNTDIVVVNLSGRGDKDLDTYKLYFESDTKNE